MEALLSKVQKAGVAFLVGGVILSRFVFVVDGGERAVKFDRVRGLQNKIYGEGMHFVIPFFQVRFLQLSYQYSFRSLRFLRSELDHK